MESLHRRFVIVTTDKVATAKLIYLLVYGRDRPYFKQKQNNITKFRLISYFIIFFYPVFTLLFYFNQNFNLNKTKKDLSHVESSHRRCSVRKGVFENFRNFTQKHLSWSLFIKKLQAFRPSVIYLISQTSPEKSDDILRGVFCFIL